MKNIFSPNAPKPIGPYSQAVEQNGFLFLSGQIPIDPKTGEVQLFDGDIAKQTELVLKNLRSVLEAANKTPKNIVKTTIFLTDLKNFSIVNEVYAKFFGDHKPARSCVEVSALPKGAAIEIEAMAS